ncbi:MAG: hypothetical protein ACPH63_06790, partial [Flavobacteriaceae bacterium]
MHKREYVKYGLYLLFFFGISIANAQNGPTLSEFSQDNTSVDISSGGVTITLLITASDDGTISSVSANPYLSSQNGDPEISSGYDQFSTWNLQTTSSSNWTPEDENDIFGWWDASDTTTINQDQNGYVSSVLNKANSWWNLEQSISTNKIRTGISTIGGLNTLTSDGNDWLATSYRNITSSVSNDKWMIITAGQVGNNVNSKRNAFWSLDDNYGSSDEDIHFRAGDGSNFYGALEGGPGMGWSPDTQVFGNYNYEGEYIISSTVVRSDEYFYSRINGEQKVSGQGTNDIDARNIRFLLFVNRNGNQKMPSGSLFTEILLINSDDSSLLNKIEGYLAHKWGLEGYLVNSHPYKSSAPSGQIKTFEATLFLDPDHVPAGTYNININHLGFQDNDGNNATLPSGYNNFDLIVINSKPDPTLSFDDVNKVFGDADFD